MTNAHAPHDNTNRLSQGLMINNLNSPNNIYSKLYGGGGEEEEFRPRISRDKFIVKIFKVGDGRFYDVRLVLRGYNRVRLKAQTAACLG